MGDTGYGRSCELQRDNQCTSISNQQTCEGGMLQGTTKEDIQEKNNNKLGREVEEGGRKCSLTGASQLRE